MPLPSIADENGDITFNTDGEIVPPEEQGEIGRPNEFCIQSIGDPALDRILVRCHVVEMNTRKLEHDIARVEKAISRVGFTVLWQVGLALATFALFAWLSN